MKFKEIVEIIFKCKWCYLRRRILCYSPIQVYIDQSSTINVTSRMRFNYNFSHNRVMHNLIPGSLNITNRSIMNVDHFVFHQGCQVSVNNGGILSIKSGYMNANGQIDCYNSITIGEHVKIGPNVVIRDSDNHFLLREGNTISAPIRIEDDVWIGLNCIILKGVTIGKGAIIGAGSIVTRSVPSYCLAVGSPAKVIKTDVKYH